MLRIDPTLPLLWRSPHTLQIGLDPPTVRVPVPDPGLEVLIGALRAGVSLRRLWALAADAGVRPVDRDRLIAVVGPALEPAGGAGLSGTAGGAGGPSGLSGAGGAGSKGTGGAAGDAGLGDSALSGGTGVSARGRVARSPPRWALCGPSALRAPLARAAEMAGWEPAAEVDALPEEGEAGSASLRAALFGVEVAVLVGAFTVTPARFQPWLSRDIPHLGVVIGDRRVRVGPFVEPGDGPCLACDHAARLDADPAWEALVAQAVRLRPAALAPAIMARAAAAAIAAVRTRVEADNRELRSAILEFDAFAIGPRRRERVVHPECLCSGLEGIVSPLVPRRGHRPAPRTRRGDGAHE